VHPVCLKVPHRQCTHGEESNHADGHQGAVGLPFGNLPGVLDRSSFKQHVLLIRVAIVIPVRQVRPGAKLEGMGSPKWIRGGSLCNQAPLSNNPSIQNCDGFTWTPGICPWGVRGGVRAIPLIDCMRRPRRTRGQWWGTTTAYSTHRGAYYSLTHSLTHSNIQTFIQTFMSHGVGKRIEEGCEKK